MKATVERNMRKGWRERRLSDLSVGPGALSRTRTSTVLLGRSEVGPLLGRRALHRVERQLTKEAA